MGTWRPGPRLVSAGLAAVVLGQIGVLVTHDPPPAATASAPAPAPSPSPSPDAEPARPRLPAPSPSASPSPSPQEQEPALQVITDDEGGTLTAGSAPSRRAAAPVVNAAAAATFEGRFPEQAAAVQDPADPATTRWAVLIGINRYQGSTRDNIGSRQDAQVLRDHLVSMGWRADHIVLLTDLDATRAMVEAAIGWLAAKTDQNSVAVFHYSGHTKQWPGRDADGDGEVPDEALWPADNRHMTDGELAGRLAAVPAGRLWVNVGACEAAGYADPGLRGPGRILTFSSGEAEKSYEDPAADNSVWGEFLIDSALRNGQGDLNGDGEVTVEEAFNFAAPRAAQRTASQRPYGPQRPQVVDEVPGDFSLRIPAPPPPPGAPPAEPQEPGGRACTLLVLCTQTRP